MQRALFHYGRGFPLTPVLTQKLLDYAGATRMAERIRKHSEEDPPMLLVYALLLYETILSLRRAKKLLVISLKLGFQPVTTAEPNFWQHTALALFISLD
jgi:hypothetical protein